VNSLSRLRKREFTLLVAPAKSGSIRRGCRRRIAARIKSFDFGFALVASTICIAGRVAAWAPAFAGATENG
jgi:hypothetical protein